MQINSTDIAGLFAFVPASLTSGLAFARSKDRHGAGRRTWGIAAAIYALLAVEVLAKTRYAADHRLRQWLMRAHEYSGRRVPQGMMLLVIAALAILVASFIVRKAPNGAAQISAAATIAVVALFLAESVSLHGADAVFYAPAGPIAFIGWLWLACGWSSAAAAMTLRT